MTTSFAHFQFLPTQILEFDSLPSTNDYLKDAVIADDIPEGTVVRALHQTSGKGQQTKTWESEPGKNITLSVLLKPSNLKASEVFRLSKTIALAVHNTISHFIKGTTVSIKWPNDIFAGNQKIAGILIENGIQGGALRYSVIGIGINVNQEVFLTHNNPTSFINITGKTFELKEVMDILFENISTAYLQLQLKNYKKIDTDYFQRLHHVYEEQTFLINDEPKTCIIDDVLPDGSIILTIDGKKEVYLHGNALWKL